MFLFALIKQFFLVKVTSSIFLSVVMFIAGSAIVGLGTWAVWWQGYVELVDALFVGLLLVCFGIMLVSTTVYNRIAAVLVMVSVCYVFGGHSERQKTNERINAAVSKVHATYREARLKDEKRQAEEARQARERSEAERLAWQAEKEEFEAKLEAANAAINADQHAERPSLSLEAVERLNRFR